MGIGGRGGGDRLGEGIGVGAVRADQVVADLVRDYVGAFAEPGGHLVRAVFRRGQVLVEFAVDVDPYLGVGEGESQA
ncbi:hypothetical protein ACFXG4_48515 [Nocardia sp. NPDC059246]|uniref:hypothetical protein n=1 Tax=unclassified Nocardia TaxID=2637762 RepID=UPI0036C7C858